MQKEIIRFQENPTIQTMKFAKGIRLKPEIVANCIVEFDGGLYVIIGSSPSFGDDSSKLDMETAPNALEVFHGRLLDLSSFPTTSREIAEAIDLAMDQTLTRYGSLEFMHGNDGSIEVYFEYAFLNVNINGIVTLSREEAGKYLRIDPTD